MEPQTESSTPVMNVDHACFEKAKLMGDPTFTLRAQDISAPLAVLFWAKCQQRIRAYLNDGMSLEEAVDATRKYYFLESVPCGDPKIDGALEVAKAMRLWPGIVKLAD